MSLQHGTLQVLMETSFLALFPRVSGQGARATPEPVASLSTYQGLSLLDSFFRRATFHFLLPSWILQGGTDIKVQPGNSTEQKDVEYVIA